MRLSVVFSGFNTELLISIPGLYRSKNQILDYCIVNI